MQARHAAGFVLAVRTLMRQHKAMGESTSEQGPVMALADGLAPLWHDVLAIVRARLEEPDVESIVAHGLGPLSAALLQREGRPVDSTLAQERRVAQMTMLLAPAVLDRIRAALSGPVLLLKGPEVALRYPDSARHFGDLDILVPDAQEAQRALLAAGFVEQEDPEGIWVGIHHLGRVVLPSLPIEIEIHSEPKWIPGVAPPPAAALFEAAVPARIGIEGLEAPAPAHHALLLAAHAWGHQPLRSAQDLLDSGVFAAEVPETELRRLAAAWKIERLWATTDAALDAFVAGRRTWPLRLWGRHISGLRTQTVLEDHLGRVLSHFWGYPAAIASRRALRSLFDEFRPAFDETWSEKGRRSAAAIRRGFEPVTRHRDLLGDAATRGRRRNKPTPPR